MSTVRMAGRLIGSACAAIGAMQVFGGVRVEPAMSGDATVDSHVRFMGAIFVGYGLGWVEAAASPTPDLNRMRLLAGLMAGGGLARLLTRASMGRPHRFHDVLLAMELAAPVVVEAAGRHDRAQGPVAQVLRR